MSTLFYRDTHQNGESFKVCLVMVHGNLISSQYWRSLIEHIQRRDQMKQIRCIAVDMPGFGNSEYNIKVNTIRDLSEEIFKFIKQLFSEEQIRNYVIPVGWSLGGCVCQQMVVDHYELFSRLILVASAGAHGNKVMKEDIEGNILSIPVESKHEMAKHSKISTNIQQMEKGNYEHYNHVFRKALMNSGRVPPNIEMLEYLGDCFKQSNYLDVTWALQIFDISKEVHRIKGPVLLYHGLLDRIVPVEDAYTNVHMIGKDKCTLIVNSSVSHMPPLEVPEDLAIHIINFLRV